MSKRILFLICMVGYAGLSAAQCPDLDLFWKRMGTLKASKTPLQQQLPVLLPLLDSLNRCTDKNDSAHIFLLRRIGSIFFETGDYIRAVYYRRQVVDIITANTGKRTISIKGLPAAYYWLSVAYDSLDNFREKMKALDSCLTIAIRLKYVDRASLTALYTRIEYFFDVGDYQKCIDYAAKCESLGKEYAANSTGIEKRVGEEYTSSSLGWHVEALTKLSRYEKAEQLLADKINEYDKAGLKSYSGLAYGQLAAVQEYKGNYENALSYLEKSLAYYKSDSNYFSCKQTLKDIGYNFFFRHMGDAANAMIYYRKALKLSNKDHSQRLADAFESLNIYSDIAKVFIEKGMYDSAFYNIQLAFDEIRPGITERDIVYSSPEEFIKHKKIHYITGLVIDKGDAYRKQFEYTRQKETIQAAIGIYREADQLLTKIKEEQTELESKLFWRSDSHRLYEHAIEACYRCNDMEDAFYFFERSRAVLLNDQLKEQHWLKQEDILKRTQLKKRIVQLNAALAGLGASSGEYEETEKELFSTGREFDRLQQLIRDHNPLYYQNFLDTSSISIRNVREKILKDHDALVEIFEGDSIIYIMVITAKANYVSRVDKMNFDSLAVLYNHYITNPGLLNGHYETFVRVSRDLYQLIFQKHLPAGRIIISNGGYYFPFEPLVINNNISHPVYFLTDYAVSYTYSARYLLNDFTAVSAASSRNFMGFAPVNYAPGLRLRALAGSDLSLGQIESYLPDANSLLAAKATRNNFRQHFSDYKIIQLYTHASDSSERSEPVIYFVDSALYLSELMPEKKPFTQLIVLSACETGNGINYQGEGVFSFNRGFAALGIPSSVANLWSIDNISTYKLTELFYKYLSRELPLDIALQKAKLEYISSGDGENRLPYYWAAPILVGKTDPVKLDKPFAWKYLFAGIGLVCLVLAGWKTWKKLKRSVIPVQDTAQTAP